MPAQGLLRLPDAALLELAKYLGVPGLGTSSVVSRAWRDVCCVDDLWSVLWCGPLPSGVVHASKATWHDLWTLGHGQIVQEKVGLSPERVAAHGWDDPTAPLLSVMELSSAGVAGFPVHVTCMDVRGTRVATASGGRLLVWDVGGAPSLLCSICVQSHGSVTGLLLVGPLIAVADNSGWVHVHDATSGALLREGPAHGDRINAMDKLGAWPAQGTAVLKGPRGTTEGSGEAILFTGADDGTAKAWELETGAPMGEYRGHTRPITCLQVAWLDQQGQCLVTGGGDGMVCIWQVSSSRLLAQVSVPRGDQALHSDGHSSQARCLQVFGDQLVVGSDRSVVVWRVLADTQPQLLKTFCDHQRPVRRLEVVGRLIFTCSGDYTIRVWDMDTGASVREVTAKSGAAILCFCLSGTRLFTTSLFDPKVLMTEFKP